MPRYSVDINAWCYIEAPNEDEAHRVACDKVAAIIDAGIVELDGDWEILDIKEYDDGPSI